MNKNLLLAGAITALVFTGCQNVQDQLGNKIAESVINTASNGQVKVNIDDLNKGKMDITTKDGSIALNGNNGSGNFTVTDNSGKTVVKADANSTTITDDKGNVGTFKGGDGAGRPADAPADMPSLDGATDFNYFNYSGMTSLTFAMTDENLKGYCDQLTAKIEAAGWTAAKDALSYEGADSITKTYAKDNDNLTVMCGLSDGKTTLVLQKSVKS